GRASFILGLGFGRTAQAATVAVAQPSDNELSPVNRLQQCSIFGRPGIERPKTLPIYGDAPTDLGGLLGQWRFASHTGQRLQVSCVCSLADLRSSVQVCHSIAQALPLEPFFPVPLGRTIHPEVSWVDHRGFNPQYAALLVIHL